MILLTHYLDLDGIGSIILSKYAGIEYDKIIGLGYEVNDHEYLREHIDPTQLIVVSDYRVSSELLEIYQRDFSDYIVFDHHEASLEYNDESKIFVDMDKCGTRLFYENLISPTIKNKASDYLVTLIDTYDIWRKDSPLWQEALNLNRVLFSTANYAYPDGDFNRYKAFVDLQLEKLHKDFFRWTDYELDKINYQKMREAQAIDKAEELLKIREDSQGKKFGIWWGKNKISLVCNALLERHEELDYVIAINTYQPGSKEKVNGRISVRSKEGFNVCNLYNINGHQCAGGGTFTEEFIANLWGNRIKQIPYKRSEV